MSSYSEPMADLLCSLLLLCFSMHATAVPNIWQGPEGAPPADAKYGAMLAWHSLIT